MLRYAGNDSTQEGMRDLHWVHTARRKDSPNVNEGQSDYHSALLFVSKSRYGITHLTTPALIGHNEVPGPIVTEPTTLRRFLITYRWCMGSFGTLTTFYVVFCSGFFKLITLGNISLQSTNCGGQRFIAPSPEGVSTYSSLSPE